MGYNYRIGKYEVTAKQYTDFLNAKASTDPYGLYNAEMWSSEYGCRIQRTGESGNYFYSIAPGWANRPVNYVSFWDALRFANWLNNGQGDGDTENGAYTIPDGYNGSDGRTIQRNAGAKWVLTSEDEWYKAAYYKGGANAGYWDYPTRSNSAPSNQVINPDPGNSANTFIWPDSYSLGSPYYRTNVGEFENSASAYGTFDQGGNVREWTEAIYEEFPNGIYRGIRGGSFLYNDWLKAPGRDYGSPGLEGGIFGFRVASVPEPSSIIALLGGMISLLGIRRCRA